MRKIKILPYDYNTIFCKSKDTERIFSHKTKDIGDIGS